MKTVGPQRLLVKLLEVEILEVAARVAAPGGQQPRPHRQPGPGNERGDQRRSRAVHPGDDERRRKALKSAWPSGTGGLRPGGEPEGHDARIGRMEVGILPQARIEGGDGGERAGADRHPRVWLDDAAVALTTDPCAEGRDGPVEPERGVEAGGFLPRISLESQSPGIRGRRIAIPHRAAERSPLGRRGAAEERRPLSLRIDDEAALDDVPVGADDQASGKPDFRMGRHPTDKRGEPSLPEHGHPPGDDDDRTAISGPGLDHRLDFDSDFVGAAVDDGNVDAGESPLMRSQCRDQRVTPIGGRKNRQPPPQRLRRRPRWNVDRQGGERRGDVTDERGQFRRRLCRPVNDHMDRRFGRDPEADLKPRLRAGHDLRREFAAIEALLERHLLGIGDVRLGSDATEARRRRMEPPVVVDSRHTDDAPSLLADPEKDVPVLSAVGVRPEAAEGDDERPAEQIEMGEIVGGVEHLGAPLGLEQRPLPDLPLLVDAVLVGVEEIGVGRGLNRLCHPVEGLGSEKIVVIEQRDKLAPRDIQRCVGRRGDPVVDVELDDPHPRIGLLPRGKEAGDLGVLGIGARQTRLPVGIRLSGERVEGRGEKLQRHPIHRHQDADQRLAVAPRSSITLRVEVKGARLGCVDPGGISARACLRSPGRDHRSSVVHRIPSPLLRQPSGHQPTARRPELSLNVAMPRLTARSESSAIVPRRCSLRTRSTSACGAASPRSHRSS